MDVQIILIFAIIGVSVVLFVTEIMPIDKIAFFIIVALALTGVTTPEDAISGFSNPAAITVLMLMIIAIGLEDNGVIGFLSKSIKRLSTLPLLLMVPVFMVVSASISSVISTTAVVIIFLKIFTTISEKFNFPTSKLLMPISFAGILGGSCTLMGTSTNLLVNSVASKYGVERFSFFEFSLYGLVFLAIGVVFMTIASRFLPKNTKDKLSEYSENSNFLFTLIVRPESKYVGAAFSEVPFYNNPNISVLKLVRQNTVNTAPGKNTTLRANDELVLMSDIQDFSLISEDDFILSLESDEIENQKVLDKNMKFTYLELLILPGSEFIDKSLQEIKFLFNSIGQPIGIQKKKMLQLDEHLYLPKAFKKLVVKAGDRILLKINKKQLENIYNYTNVVVLRHHEDDFKVDPYKRLWCVIVLLAVIALAATSVLSILTSTIAGVGALLLADCINLSKIYKRVNWQIFFLLAGMIPLGVAMGNTGADLWISGKLLYLLSGQGSTIVLGSLFAMTMIMSGFISNNATAVIVTPIAIALATSLQLPVKPFVLAVMFGANFSFFTPMGYQTNALIYGTGIYRFKHFLIIGGLLSIILLIAGTLLLSTMLNTQN
ncbi:SLC13 family permease [Subsaximicrobium wynnwilliamsii]|uniref:SLC13 family permease n=1 Tax=Subsaximicrobium wynnwilliamsii TaxID=291179 RepID=A0A5C6ZGR6_9FLAO|nr:SLC13 family permease [Subsaximicrobium wynnwilliamsii]TXD84111.1 SLC13 family permease [Subsaximicrobium wynnwilliamsii]TXD88931.1 SLC13 family permease [Subsaximicrobium wynnwilliamsii]TXE03823.1 SLC13 family permease [Subsaximicrobium wynnwilliamsii]